MHIDISKYKGTFVKCLEFINGEFFAGVETAMSGVVEALTAFEEKCKSINLVHVILWYWFKPLWSCFVAAGEWIASQNIDVLEKHFTEYISRVFLTADSDSTVDSGSSSNAWASPDEIAQFEERILKHRRYVRVCFSILVRNSGINFFQVMQCDAGRGMCMVSVKCNLSSNKCSWAILLHTMVLLEATKKSLRKQVYCRRSFLFS